MLANQSRNIRLDLHCSIRILIHITINQKVQIKDLSPAPPALAPVPAPDIPPATFKSSDEIQRLKMLLNMMKVIHFQWV